MNYHEQTFVVKTKRQIVDGCGNRHDPVSLGEVRRAVKRVADCEVSGGTMLVVVDGEASNPIAFSGVATDNSRESLVELVGDAIRKAGIYVLSVGKPKEDAIAAMSEGIVGYLVRGETYWLNERHGFTVINL